MPEDWVDWTLSGVESTLEVIPIDESRLPLQEGR